MAIACASRRAFTFLLGAAVATGAASGRRARALAAEPLKGAGTSFASPLVQQWIKVYQREHKTVSITYDTVGLEEDLRRFNAGLVDFAAVDVVLTDGDTAQKDAVLIPATAGMVVFAYNLPGVQGELKLSREVYFGIFSGAIRRWDDPRIKQANPDLALPRHDITIVVPEEGGGMTAALSANLAKIDPTWRKQGFGVGSFIEWPTEPMTARDNEGVAALIKASEGSIGYLDYAIAKRASLPIALVQTWVRGVEADGRNQAEISMIYEGQIRGVCLSRSGSRGRLFDGEDLLRY